jgi:dephospho-CoA kinase
MGLRVAIYGRFCVGKTSVARSLEEDFGFIRVSMAENLKSIVLNAYGTLDKSKPVDVTSRSGEPIRLSIREVLQGIGEAVKSVDRDLWLRWFLNDTRLMSGEDLVMDDLRLPFEADVLRDQGWLIVRLDAPEEVRMERHQRLYGRLPTLSELMHPTETQMDEIVPDLVFDGRDEPEDIADAIIGELVK